MKIEFKSTGYTKDIAELVELPHVIEAVDTQMLVIVESNKTLTEQVETLTTERDEAVKIKAEYDELKSEIGEYEIKDLLNACEELKAVEAEALKLKAALVDEITTMQVLAKQVKDDAESIEAQKAVLMLWTPEQLKATKEVLENLTKTPGKPQSNTSEEDEKEISYTQDSDHNIY